MRRLLPAVLLAMLTGASAVAAGEAPRRIVSLSLCADQFVLAVADRDRIAAVSLLAGDPYLSPAASLAEGLPRHDGRAESVLMLKPDLVVTGGFTRRSTLEMLERLGVPVLKLPTASSLDDIPGQIEQLAAAVGASARGHALADRIRTQITPPPGRSRLTAALFRPGGDVPGGRSLITDMLARAGLQNIADHYAHGATGRVALEDLVLNPPDILVIDSRRSGHDSQGQALLDHPALAPVAGRMRPVEFPLRYWLCAGPGAVEGVPLLASAAQGGAP
ncbi:ABC transporter substrate-binding protein [Oleisolibacter albus]|uniref:ABC transporter substrate-binding protein n=1 Tax=Oleisolibacter albus TaxID=2171757 RepID=UPI0012D84F87|nr:ABC transporter substrate-binding protein [Oleisolibacter albus]